MGLFFKKKDKADPNVIYSPLNGTIKAIESLKDKTFADKVMGDGIAIVPNDGNIYAPIDGVISALLDTKHAYGLTSDSGYELLIHIGQDTVNLQGQYFETKVKEGEKVKKGQLLGTFEIANIKKKGYDISTPVILIDGGDYKIANKTEAKEVKVGDVLLTLGK